MELAGSAANEWFSIGSQNELGRIGQCSRLLGVRISHRVPVWIEVRSEEEWRIHVRLHHAFLRSFMARKGVKSAESSVALESDDYPGYRFPHRKKKIMPSEQGSSLESH
jgi:hypothetical protein